MKDNKKIEAAKKLIELMQAYVDGKDIEKLINGNYIAITESDSIELICMYNISKYRVITINNCVRIVDNNADKKEIDVINNNFTYMLFDLIKSDLFNKIIDGTYKDSEL